MGSYKWGSKHLDIVSRSVFIPTTPLTTTYEPQTTLLTRDAEQSGTGAGPNSRTDNAKPKPPQSLNGVPLNPKTPEPLCDFWLV